MRIRLDEYRVGYQQGWDDAVGHRPRLEHKPGSWPHARWKGYRDGYGARMTNMRRPRRGRMSRG